MEKKQSIDIKEFVKSTPKQNICSQHVYTIFPQ
jgi:hypothetical protein